MIDQYGYELKYEERLSKSPCVPIAVKGWQYLLDRKLSDIHMADGVVDGSHNVVWIEHQGEPVAVMTFNLHDEYAWIRVSYVESWHRRVHLYEQMYNKVREICKEKKCPKISSGIVSENTAMIAAAKKVGRHLEYAVWTEDLKYD